MSQDTSQASGGMQDFANLLLFLGMFGTLSLVPTGLALYFLRTSLKFWTVFSVLSPAFAMTGLVSAALVQPSWGVMEFVKIPRILGAPVFCLAFLISAALAPSRSLRAPSVVPNPVPGPPARRRIAGESGCRCALGSPLAIPDRRRHRSRRQRLRLPLPRRPPALAFVTKSTSFRLGPRESERGQLHPSSFSPFPPCAPTPARPPKSRRRRVPLVRRSSQSEGGFVPSQAPTPIQRMRLRKYIIGLRAATLPACETERPQDGPEAWVMGK